MFNLTVNGTFNYTQPITTTNIISTTGSTLTDLNEMIFNTNKNYTYLDSFVQANCILPFYFIEIVQSAIQILVSVS